MASEIIAKARCFGRQFFYGGEYVKCRRHSVCFDLCRDGHAYDSRPGVFLGGNGKKKKYTRDFNAMLYSPMRIELAVGFIRVQPFFFAG